MKSLLHPQNRETGKTLGLATLLMFTIPIVGFYVGMHYFADRKHPENYAGGIAILLTNVIIGGYCYSALTEDDDDENENDSDGPRTGKYKQRTD